MADAVLLENGLVVDGSGGPSWPGDVLIVGDRIARVGAGLLDRLPAGLQQADVAVVDCRGQAIAPGFIDVGMSKGMPDEVTANFIKQIPLGRLGDAENIVDAALFLCSPMASYVTGHVLNVNGGFYMG